MIIIYKNKVAVMDCILSPIQSYTVIHVDNQIVVNSLSGGIKTRQIDALN